MICNNLNMENEKYLLVDFNSERWKGITKKSIRSAYRDLCKRIKKGERIYGQIDHPETMLDDLHLISHEIFDIEIEDMTKIFGSVRYNNSHGIAAEVLINSKKYKFGIRGIGTQQNEVINLTKIISFDVIPNI